MVTVFELFCGIEKAKHPDVERAKVERFVSTIHQLPLDRASAEASAHIRIELERQGTPIRRPCPRTWVETSLQQHP